MEETKERLFSNQALRRLYDPLPERKMETVLYKRGRYYICIRTVKSGLANPEKRVYTFIRGWQTAMV